MNNVLTDDVIKQFDYASIKKNIINFISSIDLLCFKLKKLEKPKITPNYEIKYSFGVPVANSKIESFVLNKIYLENQIEEIISKYVNAINSLNKMEREVFIKTYLYETKDEIICYEMNIIFHKLLQIRKSASIKFNLILDLDKIYD